LKVKIFVKADDFPEFKTLDGADLMVA